MINIVKEWKERRLRAKIALHLLKNPNHKPEHTSIILEEIIKSINQV